MFHKLLIALFKFLSPFLTAADLQPASRDLYRGSLRLLLVLLHDFPEFLSEYYFTLCDIIPPRCIQLRNIILSAFPPNIMLPDPHFRNVKFESIPEMGPIPPILSDFAAILKTGDLVTYLDQYLLNRGSPSFLTSLKDKLRLPSPQDPEAETYNLSLINAVVLYIGSSSVAQAKARSGTALFVSSDPGVVALQYLATNLDVEGKLALSLSLNDVSNHACRATSSSQRHGTAPPLPECTYTLVQLFDAVSLPRSEGGSFPRDHDESPLGEVPCSSSPPLGRPGHIHRAAHELQVRLLESGFHPRRTGGHFAPRDCMSRYPSMRSMLSSSVFTPGRKVHFPILDLSPLSPSLSVLYILLFPHLWVLFSPQLYCITSLRTHVTKGILAILELCFTNGLHDHH